MYCNHRTIQHSNNATIEPSNHSTMKDNFSTQAKDYADYRPQYPAALFDFLYSHVPAFGRAWDCATGNGQVAMQLAEKFTEVYATDISEKQLQQAPRKNNIVYTVEQAEHSSFPDRYFHLITVAQAIHWFRFEAFYREVKRTIVPGGLLAVIGYGLISIDTAIDPLVQDFYTRVIGPYWDAERTHIDQHYRQIPFPFTQLPAPELFIRCSWTRTHFIGYLNTWSAVQHYIKKEGQPPITAAFTAAIEQHWPGDTVKEIRFPLFIKAAVIP